MPNRSALSRRAFSCLAGASLFGALLPYPAIALNNAEAQELIGRLVDDINEIINSGKLEKAMLLDFEKLLNKYSDVPIIARSSLGVAWRSASSSEQKKYTKAFSGYISRKYGKRFREFIGGKIVVIRAKKVKSGYLVYSVAHLAGEAPFTIEWQVSGKSGTNKMFNIIIEGISLLATERTEITAMLDKRKGNLNKLIADLKKLG